MKKKKLSKLSVNKKEEDFEIAEEPDHYLVEIIDNLFIGGTITRLPICIKASCVEGKQNRCDNQSFSGKLSKYK